MQQTALVAGHSRFAASLNEPLNKSLRLQQKKFFKIGPPDDGTTELLFAQLPHENGSSEGLSYSSVLPVKEGDELIMYGGWKGSHHKGIWRYTASDNTWIRIGSTMIARGEHVTLPVHGIACP